MPKFVIEYTSTDAYVVDIEAATLAEAIELVRSNSRGNRTALCIAHLQTNVTHTRRTDVCPNCPDCFSTDGTHTRASCTE